MRETSFGKMNVLFKENEKPVIEHLIFEDEGRAHKHREYETFVTLSGTGKVYSGEHIFEVKPGSIVTIPPRTIHWMAPTPGTVLTGFLWYHLDDTSLNKG